MKLKRKSFIFCILAAIFMGCNSTAFAEPIHPILREATQVNLLIPDEQRDDKYGKFLCVSVKISVDGAAGSGTICHFDKETGWAYVVSCGHLWNGNKSYDVLKPSKAKIITWYKNEIKLKEYATYDAEALFWSNARGYDVSLLRFKPDWNPNYASFAGHFHEATGRKLNSMGCDGGKEVARYEVEFFEMRGQDLIAKRNSPRPGRSGGGLLTDEGQIVGVCWGSSDIVEGNGEGYFTPLKSIRDIFSKNGHEWVMDIKSDLESIPVKDWSNPRAKHDRHYVPVPVFTF